MRGSKLYVCSAVVAVSVLGLAGCGMQMADDTAPDPKAGLILGVPDSDTIEPSLLPGIRATYVEKLEGTDHPVRPIAVTDAKRIEDVRNGQVDVTFGCVGELLDLADANAADRLRSEYAAEEDPDPVTWRDAVHSTLLGTMPGGVTLSNPGIAEVCEDETLPQNIVAVYRAVDIDREDTQALNNVAGGTSVEAFADNG